MNTTSPFDLKVSLRRYLQDTILIDTKRGFTYSSGKISPIYCDIRSLLSNVTARETIIYGLMSAMNKSPVDAIIGVATGGIPYAMAVADRLGIPFGYVRNLKDHGVPKKLEGLSYIGKGKVVCIIDDVVNSGDSIVAAQGVAQAFGYNPRLILSVLDYESDEFAELKTHHDISCKSLLGRGDLEDAVYKLPTSILSKNQKEMVTYCLAGGVFEGEE